MYVDLDGTLLGPSGSLLHAAPTGASRSTPSARCRRATGPGSRSSSTPGGATRASSRTRSCSARARFIFELGCGLVIDGELEWLTDGVEPSSQEAGTIHDQIEASGGPSLLLERFGGSLEYHTPWSDGRDVSHLFRGLVSTDEAHRALAEAELDWLRLVDNGVIRMGSNGGADRVHCYHLIPASASKARAVARHMQNRGYRPEECIAVGDSREDMDAATVVGTFWLVGNALDRDPTLAAEAVGRPGVRIAEAGHGAGVYEAVVTTLAGAEPPFTLF